MRGKKAKKRLITPDPIYRSRLVTRLVSVVMLSGKKSLAEKVVYNAIEKLSEDKKEGIKMFENAIKNVMPKQEVRSRRVGGATYQVPTPVKHDRAEALAMRWIVQAARKTKGKPMTERLYEVLKNAHGRTGDAIKKKEDT